MRLLILDTCYPAFLAAHYSRVSGLGRRPYREQWRSLMATFFGTADSYSHALDQLGHQAHEVVANAGPLQRAWLKEHQRRTPTIPFRFQREKIVFEQAVDYKPDVVYVQNMRFFSNRLLARLRGLGMLVVGQIASEPPAAELVRAYDLVLTSFPHFVERFRKLGVRSEYLRIGFDPRVLEHLGDKRAPRSSHEAVFVGALNRTQHRSANELLERAAKRVPIDFWGYGGAMWPPGSPIRTRYHGEAWGLEMFRVLYESRIAINRHIGVAGQWANNMRLYEATGVGTLLLTDDKKNLGTLFTPGQEILVYRNEQELVERIQYYLEHEDERQAIARAGHERTLREHTYKDRMRELVSYIEALA